MKSKFKKHAHSLARYTVHHARLGAESALQERRTMYATKRTILIKLFRRIHKRIPSFHEIETPVFNLAKEP